VGGGVILLVRVLMPIPAATASATTASIVGSAASTTTTDYPSNCTWVHLGKDVDTALQGATSIDGVVIVLVDGALECGHKST
jgi:hypothetical protein